MPHSAEYSAILTAYSKFTPDELSLFLKVRKLPTSGPPDKQAARLTNHDLHTYHISSSITKTATANNGNDYDVDSDVQYPGSPNANGRNSRALTKAPIQLPIELIAEIMDHINDWELSEAVRVPTSLEIPPDWKYRASKTDYLILTCCGDLSAVLNHQSSSSSSSSISNIINNSNTQAPGPAVPDSPTKLSALLCVRMSYIPILDWLLSSFPHILQRDPTLDLIPIRASRWGRTDVLSWYKHIFTHHPSLLPPPKPHSIAQSLEAASRRGMVQSLDWWWDESGFREIHFEDNTSPESPLQGGTGAEKRTGIVGGLCYTEAALEHASAKSQIAILEWWKTHHTSHPHLLPLKVGRSLDTASTTGSILSLSWWASNPQLMSLSTYGAGGGGGLSGGGGGSGHALYHASCNGRIGVLDWWLESGLQLSYDSDVLIGATKHDRPEVLSWWESSGLVVQYRACDIEEALEDAIGGGEAARQWWLARGLDFSADDREWTKLQSLGGRSS